MACIQQEIILNGRIDRLVEDAKSTQIQLDERYAQEEILWRQNSRIQWLKDGEKKLPSFTKPWFSEGRTTESSNCTTTKVKLLTPNNKSNRNLFITFRSCSWRLKAIDEFPLNK